MLKLVGKSKSDELQETDIPYSQITSHNLFITVKKHTTLHGENGQTTL